MYQLLPNHPIFGQAKSIRRIADGANIPMDEQNSDYQQYLAWLEAGNTPLPADEPTA